MDEIDDAKFIISIHALRGEGDGGTKEEMERLLNFNPRPPWGGRRQRAMPNVWVLRDFNPRPPWGGRHERLCKVIKNDYFNPRPPWGGRRG